MSVLVDSSIWSIALRRNPEVLAPHQITLRETFLRLIREGQVQIIGPIRQEVLSGIRHESQFQRLQRELRAFDDVELVTEDYEEASRMFNLCQAKGVSGSHIDFLICAVAARRRWSIFTTDRDFRAISTHFGLDLFDRSL